VTSWDVVNEIVGDGVSSGMTALQCVQQKNSWPTVTSDGSGKTFATDLGFVRAAFKTALQYAPASARLAINDYNTGSANAAKTQCMFPILADIVANAGVPYNRLAVGFQSHVTAAAGQFVGKADLASTFAKLAALGADALVTELDVSRDADGSKGRSLTTRYRSRSAALAVRTSATRLPSGVTTSTSACMHPTATSSSTGSTSSACSRLEFSI
jgi:endo-1,4-beta-xylanase